MRRSMRGGVLLLVAVALLAAGPSSAEAQTPAPNHIVVYATFGNGEPPPGASLTIHVGCEQLGVDETATMSAPWDPVSFAIPVLAAGGPNTYAGCLVSGQWADIDGFPEITCGVAEPGSPPPDPPPPSGCGANSRNTFTDLMFAETVSGAVYDVVFTILLAPTSPAPAPDAVAAAPTFTG
jgi:hypothetical protein